MEYSKRRKLSNTNFEGVVRPKRITYSRAFKNRSLSSIAGLYRQMRGEKKFKDFTVGATSTAMAATGTITNESFCLLSAGTGESQVIGRQIILKNINLKMRVNKPFETNAVLGTLTPDDTCRVILYIDKQCNGAAATPAQILQSTVSWNSFRDLENVERFQVLMDKTITFNSKVDFSTVYYYGEESRFLKFNKNCSLKIDYGATPGSVIGDVKSYNIGMLAISKSGLCTVEGNLRIRYTE